MSKTYITAASFEILETAKGEIQIFPAGKFRANDGRPREMKFWNIDKDIASKVLSKVKEQTNPMVIDYNHASMMGGLEAPAAGWIDRANFFWNENGLFAKPDWTTRAKQQIDAKEQRYISPVFSTNKNGDIIDLFNIAITNTPALDGMQAIALSKFFSQSRSEFIMSEAEFLELLMALGMAEGTSPEDAIANAKAMSGTQTSMQFDKAALDIAKAQVSSLE
ncbi:MAG: hypothetical protein KAI17_18900, partial [Thiotrichaceae bacterium]|nr:hypothetical protein [Thiotrichaceae bacterium]